MGIAWEWSTRLFRGNGCSSLGDFLGLLASGVPICFLGGVLWGLRCWLGISWGSHEILMGHSRVEKTPFAPLGSTRCQALLWSSMKLVYHIACHEYHKINSACWWADLQPDDGDVLVPARGLWPGYQQKALFLMLGRPGGLPEIKKLVQVNAESY